MPEYCTCGARLAEDARFCHRCARPVSGTAVHEESEAESEAEPIAAPPPSRPVLTPPPVAFNNPIALRVAGFMSLGIMLTLFVPYAQMLFILWLLAAGWGGVVLYRRLTGISLNVRSGARLGTITGVLSFLGMAVVYTLAMATDGRQFMDQLKDQMVRQDPRMADVVNNPTMLAAVLVMVLLLGLLVVFTLVVAACAAGGALGGRYVSRGGNRPA